jgi:rubrerythrin
MDKLDAYALTFQMKANGSDFYRGLSEKVADVKMKKSLELLTEMEEENLTYISGKIAEIRAKYPELSGEMVSELDIYSEQTEKQGIEKYLSDKELGNYFILRLAYFIEADFIDFFSQSERKYSGESKQVFEELIAREHKHVKWIKELIDKEIDEKGLSPDLYSLEDI